MPPRRENWRQQAQQMRQQSRAQTAPTFQLGDPMPTFNEQHQQVAGTRAALAQKLAWQRNVKARQAWLSAGNMPAPLAGETDRRSAAQLAAVPNPGQQWQPSTPGQWHNQQPATPAPGQGTVGLPQPQTPRRGGGRNRNNRYPGLTY